MGQHYSCLGIETRRLKTFQNKLNAAIRVITIDETGERSNREIN
jgi:hypothetical protein